MATIIDNGSNATVTLNSGDIYILPNFIFNANSVDGETNVTISGTSVATNLNIFGDIYNGNDLAIRDLSGATGTRVTIGTTGIVSTGGTSNAILLGNDSEVYNAGFVSAGGSALSMGGAGTATIVNDGSLISNRNGQGIDISFQATSADITNNGNLSSLDGGSGIFSGAVENVIFNNGTISGDSYGVLLYATQEMTSSLVTNTGIIQNTGSSGTVAVWGNGTFANSGTVIAENFSFDGGGAETIQSVLNSGIMFGDVFFGAGNDVYEGSSSGQVIGQIQGGNGNDTLNGSDAVDDLRGGNQGDLINGGGGDDDLLGEQGQDILNGGDGNDRLFGQANGDRLDGGAGLDFLTGGLAADIFFFRRGNDVDIIQDFAVNTAEKIDVSDFETAAAQAAINNAYQVGNQVRIDFGDGDLLALNGLNVADIDFADFIFA